MGEEWIRFKETVLGVGEKCVGQGKLGKRRREKGGNGGVRK